MKKFYTFLRCYFDEMILITLCLLLLDALLGGQCRPIEIVATVLLMLCGLSLILGAYASYYKLHTSCNIGIGAFLRFAYHYFAMAVYERINMTAYVLVTVIPYSPIHEPLLRMLVWAIEGLGLHERKSYAIINRTLEPARNDVPSKN